MRYTISLTIQKVIEVPEESEQEKDEQDAVSSVTKELEAAGWQVDLDSFEPLAEDYLDDDEDEDDEDDEDEEDDDEEDEE